MLVRFVQQRARHLVAAYVESDRVELLWAHRKWRSWEIESSELYPLPEGETVYESLQRLNLRIRNPGKTAFVLFLSLPYYSLHREHYPVALEPQLEHAVAFDWQENLFYDPDQMLSFAGPACRMERHLSVPIFSIRREVAEKFNLALSGTAYQSFSLVPSALYYSVFGDGAVPTESQNGGVLQTFGRMTNPRQMEVHRYLDGALLESYLVGKTSFSLQMAHENLTCCRVNGDDVPPRIELVESTRHPDDSKRAEAFQEDLPIRVHALDGLMIERWVPRLLQEDVVKTFDAGLVLKPWEIPKVVWPVLAAVLLYGIFALYEVHDFNQAREASTRLKRHIATLESQWKPIEQLQTRIAKFEEDQKTLSQFDLEGYPLLEMLTLLSNVTPEDTYLNYFSIRKGQVILRGESKSAIKFLPELSKIEGFSDVKFASPVTRNPSADSERFNVQLQLDLEKFRKAVAGLPVAHEDEKVDTVGSPSEETPSQSPSDSKVQAAPPPEEEEEGEEDEGDEAVVELEEDEEDTGEEESGENAQ
ncbi:MAG: PilN domain-containing protein [Syntrophobacteraceae bacterium]